jgi:hypothetical protein
MPINSRIDLQNFLEDILGSRNVYYQSPGNKTMNYPAIVYEMSDIRNNFANNGVYKQSHYYKITIISSKLNDKIIDKISLIPNVRFNRHFVSDGLYHDIFTIYY